MIKKRELKRQAPMTTGTTAPEKLPGSEVLYERITTYRLPWPTRIPRPQRDKHRNLWEVISTDRICVVENTEEFSIRVPFDAR
jgi:hypothetical protein